MLQRSTYTPSPEVLRQNAQFHENARGLRPAKDLIRIVGSYEEAFGVFPELESRQIGALVIRGLVPEPEELIVSGDFEAFGHLQFISHITRGDGELYTNLTTRNSFSSETGKVTQPVIFNRDIPMHFDGYSIIQLGDNPTDAPDLEFNHGFLHPETYAGVGHHITYEGGTNLIVESMPTSLAEALAEDLERQQFEVDPGFLTFPESGEVVSLKAGDYVALHQYPTHHGQSFIHGTKGSTENRKSVVFDPAHSNYTLLFNAAQQPGKSLEIFPEVPYNPVRSDNSDIPIEQFNY